MKEWDFIHTEKSFEEIVKEWKKTDDEEEVDIGIEVDELPPEFL